MKNYKKEEIEKFVDCIKEGYSKATYTKELCDVRGYSSSTDSNKQFIQMPIQINMGPMDFSGTVNNTFLGGSLGESIAFGEFNYMLDKVKRERESNKINDVTLKTIQDILCKLPPDFNPQAMLIPIKNKYYHQFHELVDQGIAKYEPEGLVLYAQGNKIKIIWSSNQRSFKEVYLVGENALTWIYKTNKEMKSIKDITDYKKEFDKEVSNVSVVYKEIGNGINFIARVVGCVEVDKNKVRVYSFEK